MIEVLRSMENTMPIFVNANLEPQCQANVAAPLLSPANGPAWTLCTPGWRVPLGARN